MPFCTRQSTAKGEQRSTFSPLCFSPNISTGVHPTGLRIGNLKAVPSSPDTTSNPSQRRGRSISPEKWYQVHSRRTAQLLTRTCQIFSSDFDDYSHLKPWKGAAEILARKQDWPALYNLTLLTQNKVKVNPVTQADLPPMASSFHAVGILLLRYFEDMSAARFLSQRLFANHLVFTGTLTSSWHKTPPPRSETSSNTSPINSITMAFELTGKETSESCSNDRNGTYIPVDNEHERDECRESR